MGEVVSVGKVDDILDGEMTSLEAGGVKIAVAQVDGTFYAFDDTCTHARCSLSRGYLDGTSVTCPCHGSVFDVTTGAVLAPPAVEPVRSYRARVERAALQVEV